MSGFERHADIVALLLIAGADPNKINQYGRKAWQDSRGDANRVYTAFKHRGRGEVTRGWPITKKLCVDFVNLPIELREAEFQIMQNLSNDFSARTPFPIQNNTLQAVGTNLARKLQIVQFAQNSRIIVHAKVRKLLRVLLI